MIYQISEIFSKNLNYDSNKNIKAIGRREGCHRKVRTKCQEHNPRVYMLIKPLFDGLTFGVAYIRGAYIWGSGGLYSEVLLRQENNGWKYFVSQFSAISDIFRIIQWTYIRAQLIFGRLNVLQIWGAYITWADNGLIL